MRDVQAEAAGAHSSTEGSIFYALTRSICPDCKRVIDAQVSLRDGRVYMRKRCPEHGWMEALIYDDAEAYVSSQKYNKPGTPPLEYSTEVKDGCPLDCGLCPEHKQHTCLALIEVNTACNLSCPTCFANATPSAACAERLRGTTRTRRRSESPRALSGTRGCSVAGPGSRGTAPAAGRRRS